MKKVLLLLAAAAFVVSCNKLADDEFEIAGKIDPSLNGKSIYLEKMGGMMGVQQIDTAKIADGKFVFKGKTTDPALHFLSIEGMPQNKVEFILENGEIEVAIDKDSTFKSVQGGTYNNEKLHEYYEKVNASRKKMMSFQKKNQQVMMEAYKTNDTVVMNKLNKEYKVIGEEVEKSSNDFVKANPKAYISVLLIKQMLGMKKPVADVKKYYDALDADVKKTKEGKELGEEIKKAASAPAAPQPQPQPQANNSKVEVGKPAPSFAAPSPAGTAVSLNQALGKVTIVDFWASWCKPCRMENPNVVAMYKELHPKGLNIIGVSLDKDAAKWKEAIAADKLDWNHVSNLKMWEEPIAAQYGVKSIPATFILDAKGNIVAKDLRGDALKAKVQELLNAKS